MLTTTRKRNKGLARIAARVTALLFSGYGVCASAQQQPAFAREQGEFDAAQRAASRCESSLTNAMQALQLFPSARAECARQKATPGATTLKFEHITCWSDLDVAIDELQQGHAPFTRLRQGGSVAAVNLHTDNAARFLQRARGCIVAAQGPSIDPERARAEALAMHEPGPGGLNGAERRERDEASARAGGVVIGGNRGPREADPSECRRRDDGFYCPGGYPLLRMVWCRRDHQGAWPAECPARFKGEMERYAESPEPRPGQSAGAFEAEADAWRSDRERVRRCEWNPQLDDCSRSRAAATPLARGRIVKDNRPAPPADPDRAKPLPDDLRAQLVQRRHELIAIRTDPALNPLVVGDEFARGMVDMIVETIDSLAQPPGEPVRRLVAYLVNHKPESHAARYRNALEAVAEFQHNPAYVIGKQTPGAVAMLLGARLQFARDVNDAAKSLTASNGTAVELAQMQRSAIASSKAGLRPPGSRTGGPGTGNPGLDVGPPPPSIPSSASITPTCYQNNCLRNSIAVDKYWKTGRWQEPRRPAGYPGIEDLEDLAAPKLRVSLELRNAFGRGNAVDPMHGPNGLQEHALGHPVASSRLRIEETLRELAQRGEMGQGIVLLDQEVMLPDGTMYRGGHIANVRVHPGGRMETYDRAFGGPIPEREWQVARQVWFYRTR